MQTVKEHISPVVEATNSLMRALRRNIDRGMDPSRAISQPDVLIAVERLALEIERQNNKNLTTEEGDTCQ